MRFLREMSKNYGNFWDYILAVLIVMQHKAFNTA